MDLVIETERLLLRELLPSDAEAMFELDGNPNVHRYLGNEPVTSIEQVQGYIESIRNQYTTNGIGRFAVVVKETNEVIGWSGLKFITEPENDYVNFYDIGYRIQEQHWRKGYALESAIAWLDYGFKVLKIPTMYASAHVDNVGSNKILQKLGMKQNGQFYWRDLLCNWYELTNIAI
jgi:[ribosomal protein S5]-alanine N-acetyltransferase